MKLQSSYDTISDVPKGFEGAFKEDDGKVVFVGGDFEFKSEAEYNDVLKAKQAGFDQLHDLKGKLKALEGINPEEHKALLDELDVLRAKAKDGGNDEETIAAIVNARVERATDELTKQNGELGQKLEELEGFKLNTQKTKVLSDIIGQHVSESAYADAEFIIGAAVERQADGSYMSNGQAGFESGLSIDRLVEKAVESRPHWKKQSISGHGATGSSGAGAQQTKKQQFMALHDKAQQGSVLSVSEKKQMHSLGAELSAEQNGG